MTTFKAPVRDYNFADAQLVEIGLEKIAFAQRDSVELLTMGITALWVTNLNTKILNFGALPSDVVELGEQQEATTEKEVDADQVRDKIKELRSAAARAFGDKSAKYNQFGLKYLDDTNDSDLLKVGMVAHGVAVTYAVELATKGYDAADNTDLQTLLTTFVGGLQHQSIEIGSRDTAQESRVEAGNEIYALLENELCEAAKSYWRTRSAAKYNDYIIYNTATGGSGTNAVRQADVPGTSSQNVDLSSIVSTSTSTVTLEITGSPLRFFASATLGGAPGAAFYDVPVGTVTITPTQFSTLTGYNGSSAGAFLNVQNLTPTPAHYKITVSNVV